jgi:hypothetical protein
MARGDHIFVRRLGGLYSHHGIDCGDGSVIHYWGDASWSTRVVRSEVHRFAGGGKIETRPYSEVAALLDAHTTGSPPPRAVSSWSRDWNRAIDRLRGLPEGPFDLSTEAVMQRAETRLGEDRYDFTINNCEHFATWCKTGVSESSQVESIWRLALGPTAYWQNQVESGLRRLFRGDGVR